VIISVNNSSLKLLENQASAKPIWFTLYEVF